MPAVEARMFDAINTALSGMNAATAQLNVAANNIANSQSDNFTPQRANLSALPDNQGVKVDSYNDLDTTSDDNLSNDLVSLKTSQFLYSANATVIHASSQMLGSLLNVLDSENPYPQNHSQTDDHS